MVIEFPDGTRQELEGYLVNSQQRWRLKKITDRFTGHVDIDYASDPFSWIITDSVGRKTTVRFRDNANSQANYQRVLDYVDVPAFAGSTVVNLSVNARYTFVYQTQTVRRALCVDEIPLPPNYTTYSVDVPVLISIGLPDGSSYMAQY